MYKTYVNMSIAESITCILGEPTGNHNQILVWRDFTLYSP